MTGDFSRNFIYLGRNAHTRKKVYTKSYMVFTLKFWGEKAPQKISPCILLIPCMLKTK